MTRHCIDREASQPRNKPYAGLERHLFQNQWKFEEGRKEENSFINRELTNEFYSTE